ncbi:MAG: hypothetical protein D6795_19520 [Deltaproteobacteria bacterium]|nr:MAG: hypothetical protein D6795_19520 [Deltaproteobacteria bacterium]
MFQGGRGRRARILPGIRGGGIECRSDSGRSSIGFWSVAPSALYVVNRADPPSVVPKKRKEDPDATVEVPFG